MGRPSNRAERRAQIAEALMRVMARSGYDGASVQAIAREAGLAGGLVHYHYGAKEEILVDLVGRLADRVRARFERRVARATDPWGRLDAFIDAHLALGKDADAHAVACWVAIAAEAARRPPVHEAWSEALQASAEVLEGLVAEVLVAEDRDPRKARAAAAALLAAIHGAWQLSRAEGVAPTGYAARAIRAAARGIVRAGADA